MSYWKNHDLIVDEKWMRHALKQSESVKGKTGDNPHVGCVIVNNDILIACGATQPPGQEHAEVHAIKNILSSQYTLKNSTFYCTLEPCSFFGRTPPCTDAIVSAQPKRVVIAILDPHPKVKGEGVRILKDAGINVTIGICEQEARESLQFWISKWS